VWATVDLRFADVSTVRDGKVVSYHAYYDQLGLLTQLGLDGGLTEAHLTAGGQSEHWRGEGADPSTTWGR
jgi:hypothetical protein